MYTEKINNVLLFVYIPTHFKEMMRVATVLQESGRYHPIVVFTAKYNTVEHHINQLSKMKIESFKHFEPITQNIQHEYQTGTSKQRSIVKIVPRIIKKATKLLLSSVIKTSFFFMAGSLSLIHNEQLKQKISRWMLERYTQFWKSGSRFKPYLTQVSWEYSQQFPSIYQTRDIQLLVFPEHNLFYFTQLLTYLGRKQKIPSIIVPFSIVNTLEWAQSFSTDPARCMTKNYNKIIGALFPNWIYHFNNQSLILPPEIILIHEMLGISPKNPWLINSGDIDLIAVESEAMQQYYIDAGLDGNKLCQIGTLYNDILFSRQQNKTEYQKTLYLSLGLSDTSKPCILLALPPDQCDSRISKIDFGNYEDIIRFILKNLAKYSDNYNILVNLHPRIDKNSMTFLHDYPIIITENDIVDYIPIASIFIASVSATIRMAISCEVPVLNYDLYRYHYNDYENTPGVLTIYEKEDYLHLLEKLLNDPVYYKEIQAHQIISAKKWGGLDGQTGKRLINAIDAL